jgi:hypothetical protein
MLVETAIARSVFRPFRKDGTNRVELKRCFRHSMYASTNGSSELWGLEENGPAACHRDELLLQQLRGVK